MLEIVNHVLNIFDTYRMAPTSIDQYVDVGRNILGNKLERFVLKGETIEFHMLGFPMKSPNDRDKVLGKIPDMAEEVAIKNFRRFGDEVKRVYSKGVNINIISDGYVFNDIMEVEDKTVEEYNEIAQDMARDAPVTWMQLTDFYKGNLKESREKVMDTFGISGDVLEQRILFDSDVNSLYRGMIKFLSLDLAIRDFPSNTQLQKQAKILAREMMFRNEAYSKLVNEEFKDSIRLSMHPSVNNGTKYSFQLIPSLKAWTSPWHAALVVEGEEISTIHKKDAVGMEIVYKDGHPYYFLKTN